MITICYRKTSNPLCPVEAPHYRIRTFIRNRHHQTKFVTRLSEKLLPIPETGIVTCPDSVMAASEGVRCDHSGSRQIYRQTNKQTDIVHL